MIYRLLFIQVGTKQAKLQPDASNNTAVLICLQMYSTMMCRLSLVANFGELLGHPEGSSVAKQIL